MDFLLTESKKSQKNYYPRINGGERAYEISIKEAFTQYRFDTKEKKYQKKSDFNITLKSAEQRITKDKDGNDVIKLTFYFDTGGLSPVQNYITINMSQFNGEFSGVLPTVENHWFDVQTGETKFVDVDKQNVDIPWVEKKPTNFIKMKDEHWQQFAQKWKEAWFEYLIPSKTGYNKCLNLANPFGSPPYNCDVYVINPVLLDVEKYFNPLYNQVCWVSCGQTACETVWNDFRRNIYATMKDRLTEAFKKGERDEEESRGYSTYITVKGGKKTTEKEVWVSERPKLYTCIRNFLGLVQLGLKPNPPNSYVIRKNVLTYSDELMEEIIQLDLKEEYDRGLTQYMNNEEMSDCIQKVLIDAGAPQEKGGLQAAKEYKDIIDFKFNDDERKALDDFIDGLEDRLKNILVDENKNDKYKFFCRGLLQKTGWFDEGEALPEDQKINVENTVEQPLAIPQIIDFNFLKEKLKNSIGSRPEELENKKEERKYGTALVSKLLHSLSRVHQDYDSYHREFYIIDSATETIQTRTFVNTHEQDLSVILKDYCTLVAKALYRIYKEKIHAKWKEYVENDDARAKNNGKISKLASRKDNAEEKRREAETKAKTEKDKEETKCKNLLKNDIEDAKKNIEQLTRQLEQKNANIKVLESRINSLVNDEEELKKQLKQVQDKHTEELNTQLAEDKKAQEVAKAKQQQTEGQIAERREKQRKEAQDILNEGKTVTSTGTNTATSTKVKENTLKIKLRF